MWYFCKYKDILGKPGEGLHSYRIYNISVLDVLFTFLLAKFIQYYILEEYELYRLHNSVIFSLLFVIILFTLFGLLISFFNL